MAAIQPPGLQLAAHIRRLPLNPASWVFTLEPGGGGITAPTIGQLYPFLYLFILTLLLEKVCLS